MRGHKLPCVGVHHPEYAGVMPAELHRSRKNKRRFSAALVAANIPFSWLTLVLQCLPYHKRLKTDEVLDPYPSCCSCGAACVRAVARWWSPPSRTWTQSAHWARGEAPKLAEGGATLAASIGDSFRTDSHPHPIKFLKDRGVRCNEGGQDMKKLLLHFLCGVLIQCSLWQGAPEPAW